MNPQPLPPHSTPGANPLDQLRDIHLPEPVGWWPPAPGWWVLAALLVATLIYVAYRIWRRYQLRQYRAEALHRLTEAGQAFASHGNPQLYLRDLMVILRRTVKTAYPEAHWESLTTEQLLRKLDLRTQAPENLEQWLYANVAVEPVANAPLPVESFARALRSWIRHHKVAA